MNNIKGQSSIETITLLGFVILFSLPLLALLTSINTDESAIMQARASTQKLADTANAVYIQGPESISIISIVFPYGMKNATLEENEIVFSLETTAGHVDITAMTIAPINITDSDIKGPGEVNQGLQKIKVEYNGEKIKFTAIN